jgi:outer membrane protein OmpA-like peptidoglycan-associated protein
VSPDYTASGNIEDARAYLYAGHTVLEFDRADPALLVIRDETGAAVNYEKVGRLFMLERHLDKFTLWLNGSSTTFAAVPVTRIYSAPSAATVLSNEPEPARIMMAQAEPDVVKDPDVSALLKLSEIQLNEVRQAIAAASQNPNTSSAELQALNHRMDLIEARLVTAAAAIVRISFPTGSMNFKPLPDVAKVLIASAKGADAVNVHGHTDARIAGPDDAKIALGRALAARTFLLKNGIAGKKISVFSTAAGDFSVPNVTHNGRSINRRVEFEFVNSRIAKLKSQALGLAE